MDGITLPATIPEDRRLIIDLPPGFPVGPVELVIRPLTPYQPEYPAQWVQDRERLRAKMSAGGLLSTVHHAPEGIIPLSPEELLKIGTLAPGVRPTSDYVDEDRGTQ